MFTWFDVKLAKLAESFIVYEPTLKNPSAEDLKASNFTSIKEFVSNARVDPLLNTSCDVR